MGYLKFFDNEEVFKAKVIKLSENTVKIQFDNEVILNTSGFTYAKEPKMKIKYGTYENFNTIYKQEEDGYILSNDGSIYVEKEAIEEMPETIYTPTLEEIREQKVREMNTEQQKIIQEGISVELTDGSIEHFSLSEQDQTSLIVLSSKVKEGQEIIPWHTTNEDEHCKFYSNEDMNKITTSAINYITYHVTYFRDLRIYIRSLTDADLIDAVTYGMNIPEEYQSEPLKQMITALV